MGRVGFIYRTDVHVSDKNPSSWKGDYSAEVFGNLEQIGVMAKDRGAIAVLDGGDYFHTKAPGRNPHSLVEQTARIHKEYPCPVWTIEGNHDITSNDLASIERQPLGVLYATGVFGHLREEVFEDGDIRVRVIGVPYSPHRTLDELRSIRKKPGDTHLIAVVHALAGLKPPPSVQEFFGEPVFDYADLTHEDGPDCWAWGHWHKDQGIEVVNGRQFVNLGAVSRGALVKENLSRTPKVAFMEIDGKGLRVTPLLLQVASAEDVFDLEKKERHDKEGKEIEAFVTRLHEATAIDPSASVEETLRSLSFAQDIQVMAMEYITRARAEIG